MTTSENRRDNIKIGLSAGILLTLVISSVAFAFHAGRVRQMVDANTLAISTVAGLIKEHLALQGHVVLVERVGTLVDDIGEVKAGVKENSHSLQRIESKLNGDS